MEAPERLPGGGRSLRKFFACKTKIIAWFI
jgi:hypothetical protein